MPWDVAAGALIVREAGGRFEPLPVPGIASDDGDLPIGGFVAGNSAVWDEFRDLLLCNQPDAGKQQQESQRSDGIE